MLSDTKLAADTPKKAYRILLSPLTDIPVGNVGTLPVAGSNVKKQTNKIKTAAPPLDHIDILGRTITTGALLTQRELARYLVARGALYHFTVKLNQKKLYEDIGCYFYPHCGPAEFVSTGNGEHGRIEVRQVSITTALNDYLDFPHVGQAFRIKRETIDKKTSKSSSKTIYCITSQIVCQSSPAKILANNRKHWSAESCHWMIDWNYDEDRCQIRTGHGPENITRLRHFAIGLPKSKGSKDTTPTIMKN